MDIKKIREKLLSLGEISPDIVCVVKIGSILIVNNPNDLDYMVIVKNLSKDYIKFRDTVSDELLEDFFVYNEDFLLSILDHPVISEKDRVNFSILSILLPSIIKQEHIVYGEFKYKFDFLNRKDEVIILIKEYFRVVLPNFFKYEKILPRISYWPIIMLIFINDNSLEITQEIRNIVAMIKEEKEGAIYLKDWVRDFLMLEV